MPFALLAIVLVVVLVAVILVACGVSALLVVRRMRRSSAGRAVRSPVMVLRGCSPPRSVSATPRHGEGRIRRAGGGTRLGRTKPFPFAVLVSFRDGCNDTGPPLLREPPQRDIRVEMRQGERSWTLASGLAASGPPDYVLDVRLKVPTDAKPGRAAIVIPDPDSAEPLEVPFKVLGGGPG